MMLTLILVLMLIKVHAADADAVSDLKHYSKRVSSGHDMIHRSMLIMYDRQSFMAMINDHSV